MKIQFIPAREELVGVFDPPVPAAQILPEWYKRQPGYADGIKRVTAEGNYNHTVKHCMPVFDAMSLGYVITLPQDVEIVETESGISTNWPSDVFKQFESHSPAQVSEMPIDTETYEPVPWKLNNPWVVRTPPGYSCLFTHPMWRDDLPFHCLSGVVDTDVYNFQPVNFPCLLRRGFRGIIPMGTPMIQVIPFKRKEWESEVLTETADGDKKWQRSKRRFGHRYKKDYRQKKQYR